MKREETVDYHIRSAWHAIARMYNQQALKYGGTMSIGFALLNIDSDKGLNIDSDKGTPATKIAPLMGLETRSLTRLLKSMEDKGLISRESDTLDKRSVRIKLTAEGKIHREHSKEIVLRFNEAVKEEISAGKLNTFFEVVQGINQLIENNKIYDKILQ